MYMKLLNKHSITPYSENEALALLIDTRMTKDS